jgi:hypothetical protein
LYMTYYPKKTFKSSSSPTVRPKYGYNIVFLHRN